MIHQECFRKLTEYKNMSSHFISRNQEFIQEFLHFPSHFESNHLTLCGLYQHFASSRSVCRYRWVVCTCVWLCVCVCVCVRDECVAVCLLSVNEFIRLWMCLPTHFNHIGQHMRSVQKLYMNFLACCVKSLSSRLKEVKIYTQIYDCSPA